MIATEMWRAAVRFAGFYEVSSWGRVRSVTRFIRNRWGKTHEIKGRILVQSPESNGYLNVSFSKDGTLSSHRVHHLIAEAFLGERPEGHECLHHDGDKKNNVLSNLRWGTKLENAADTTRLGKQARGETHPHAKLTEMIVLDIRSSNESPKTLAKRYGVSTSVVENARNRKTWKHVV